MSIQFGKLDAFDQSIDNLIEPFRDSEIFSKIAALLSNASDFGAIWVVVALVKCITKDRRSRTILKLGLAGFSSLGANALLKKAFQRERPESHLQVSVRTPTSTSFPSGHTVAAFATASLLATSKSEEALLLSLASLIASSRVYLKAHYPSDVAAGAATGLALSAVCKALLPKN